MHRQIEVVSKAKLPVDESLEIKRCRYAPMGYDGSIDILPRISIVTGIHGDELEGQYTVYELARRLQEYPEGIKGIVDIYPGLNSLGIDSITRGIPDFDIDMNRIFPGSIDGSMVERVAHDIVESLTGSELVIDIHASNIFLKEIPQARINETMAKNLIPMASLLNLDFLWIHPAATVLESTLSHSLNTRNTPCIVVEMGVGMRITKHYSHQLVEGILAVMKGLNIWAGELESKYKCEKSFNSLNREVYFVNSAEAGIFVTSIEHCMDVKVGDKIGEIIDPLLGEKKETVVSPCDGLVFTLREYPVVDPGSLIARIISEEIFD